MIYVTVAFLLFSITLIYRKNKYFSSKFFIGAIIGWTISIISLILYLSQHSYYYNIVNKVFNLSPEIWNILIRLNINLDAAITLLNIGIVCFIYFLLCFALSLATEKQIRSKRDLRYLFIAIAPVLEILFYSPHIFRMTYSYIYTNFRHTISYDEIMTIYSIFNGLFKATNVVYLIGAVVIIIVYYINYPRIKMTKRYLLNFMISLFIVIGAYYIMFSWAPTILVKPTVFKGFYAYVTPKLENYVLFFNYFPYVVFLIFAFLIYSVYKFKMAENSISFENAQTHRSIDTANLGIKVFTHSVKNYLLAIQSEAEYLKSKNKDDEELTNSINIILNSCSKAFENIQSASNKLRDIRTNLKLLSIDDILIKSINSVSVKEGKIKIEYVKKGELPLLYLDEFYMTESIHNLLINAIEAIGEENQGSIIISVYNKNLWCNISIKDTGPGIDEENINKIFTPFFGTKPSVKNWGIGLAYCRSIIMAHGGRISVESKKGDGCTFEIIIPVP